MIRISLVPLVFATAAVVSTGAAQDRATLSPTVRQFVAVDAPVVALRGVRIVDGTGAPPLTNQTIVIEGRHIRRVGPVGSVSVPAGARVLELGGHTVIPGLIGLHDHMFYTQATPRGIHMPYSGPRLYLGAGVTTVRTTGSNAPYADLNMKAGIEQGKIPGPRMLVTGPYLIGPGPNEGLRQLGLHEAATAEDARRVVAYWAQEGARWVKVYTQISRTMLAAIVDEAHKHGMKVTGHLCSIGFREAVALGIDNLEHGLYANSEFDPAKVPDQCSVSYMTSLAGLDVGSADVQATIEAMVEHQVPITSTLAVIEQLVPNRPPPQQRVLDAMAEHVRREERTRRQGLDGPAEDSPMPLIWRNGLAFEKAFVDAGGLLAAGVDPAFGSLPGFGDQRNFELLQEAGFSAVQAIQILTANGAKVLGMFDQIGSIEVGKLADLVVVRGDPTSNPTAIRNVTIVFKDGLGYDSAKLIETVRGQVGLR